MRASLPVLPCLLVAALAAACGPGDDDGASCSGLLAGDLVITEVLADYGTPPGGSGADEGKEWFEIYNATSEPIELQGVVLEHGRPTNTSPSRHAMRAVTIPAGGYLVLGNVLPDLAPAHVDYGYANTLGSLFNTDGGRLALRCGETLVDEAIYGAARAGRSFALDGSQPPDYQRNDVLANWCDTEASATYEYEPANYGTPGAANPACMNVQPGMCDDGGTMRATDPPQLGDLVITEVLPDPSAVTDANGEFIEVLVNRTVDINGLGVARSTGSPAVINATECRQVQAGTYLVFARNSVMAENGGLPRVDATFTFNLTNAGDTVRVLMGATELDSLTWTSSRAGRTIQLDQGLTSPEDNDLSTNLCDGTVVYGAGDRGTPGAENSDCGTSTAGMCMDTGLGALRPIVKPTIGQLVINEWMPDPNNVADATGEWFELRATADVDLNGLQAGGATLGTTPIVPAGGDCVRLATGALIVFARTATNNGLPYALQPTRTFGFGLTNGPSMFQIGIDNANLATATWASTSVVGASWMLDSDGTQCTANLTTPDPIPLYENGIGPMPAPPGTDRGTPGAVNSPPECP